MMVTHPLIFLIYLNDLKDPKIMLGGARDQFTVSYITAHVPHLHSALPGEAVGGPVVGHGGGVGAAAGPARLAVVPATRRVTSPLHRCLTRPHHTTAVHHKIAQHRPPTALHPSRREGSPPHCRISHSGAAAGLGQAVVPAAAVTVIRAAADRTAAGQQCSTEQCNTPARLSIHIAQPSQ